MVVELGCGRGYVGHHIIQESAGLVFQYEMSKKMIEQCNTPEDNVPAERILADEEFLPFKNNSCDLVVSCLSLHWVNDLPGTFKQVNDALKNDGAFIGALFGGDTLYELRCSLQLAELEREGGIWPHISPFTQARDLGGLLNSTGFNLVTLDVDDIKVNYPSMFEVLRDLKGMGENNAAWNRPLRLKQDTMLAAGAVYQQMYGNDDGSVPATFQVFYFIGWKPDASQQQPAKRGSHTISIKDINKLSEFAKQASSDKKLQ